jgi:hypothetical protein
MKSPETLNEPANVLYRIKRGLAGYVSYLAACEMNEAFSEYVLYEPMLRILTARGFSVKCEYPCPGMPRAATGDAKKIDFDVTGQHLRFAIEAKWTKRPTLNAGNDYQKLISYLREIQGSRAFFCVFGVKSVVEKTRLTNGTFSECGKTVFAEFGVTRYGCRIYEVTLNTKPTAKTTVSETVSENTGK